MKIGPLGILNQMHGNGEYINQWVLISWHWAWSYTWRFSLVYRPWLKRILKLSCLHNRPRNLRVILFTPIGEFDYQTQDNMRRKT